MTTTPERAAYFLRRFKHDEKMLGPSEQAALDFAIAALAQQPQGSGEPVATLAIEWEGQDGTQVDIHAKGTERDMRRLEALLKRLRTLDEVAPPSAQQATGLLTDEQIERFADHAADRIPQSNYVGRVIHAVRMAEEALAAATQAQPEAATWKPDGRNDSMRHPEESDLSGGATDAAPTTGKREPLTDEQRTELARSFIGSNVPAIASPSLWFQRGISAAERAHGITGEQR